MAPILIFVFFARCLPPRAHFSSKSPKLSFIRQFNEFMKNFHQFFFQKFLILGKSPAAKNIFFAKIFFSKCISSGVFQDFSKIPKGTVREQLTLTKLQDENAITRFSLPPVVKTLKRGPCFDILNSGGKEKRVIAFLSYNHGLPITQ